MAEHSAPGWVTIQVLRGALRVRTPDARHDLAEGEILALAPDVPHDVDAAAEADMLLGAYPEMPVRSATAACAPRWPGRVVTRAAPRRGVSRRAPG